MGIITILWEKWVEFRRDFYKITLAAMIAPLMYLIVFGMGIQTTSPHHYGSLLPDRSSGEVCAVCMQEESYCFLQHLLRQD